MGRSFVFAGWEGFQENVVEHHHRSEKIAAADFGETRAAGMTELEKKCGGNIKRLGYTFVGFIGWPWVTGLFWGRSGKRREKEGVEL
jgi:hypothetical protein